MLAMKKMMAALVPCFPIKLPSNPVLITTLSVYKRVQLSLFDKSNSLYVK